MSETWEQPGVWDTGATSNLSKKRKRVGKTPESEAEVSPWSLAPWLRRKWCTLACCVPAVIIWGSRPPRGSLYPCCLVCLSPIQRALFSAWAVGSVLYALGYSVSQGLCFTVYFVMLLVVRRKRWMVLACLSMNKSIIKMTYEPLNRSFLWRTKGKCIQGKTFFSISF